MFWVAGVARVRRTDMGALQAGAARVDITPELGCHMCGYFQDRVADDVHSPLHAKAIVLGDGERTIGFVICDLIVVPRKVGDEASRNAPDG